MNGDSISPADSPHGQLCNLIAGFERIGSHPVIGLMKSHAIATLQDPATVARIRAIWRSQHHERTDTPATAG